MKVVFVEYPSLFSLASFNHVATWPSTTMPGENSETLFLPMISLAVYPNNISAFLLKVSILPSMSQVITLVTSSDSDIGTF